MPNFWTQNMQKIYECFNGPRTIDYDFDKKKQELTVIRNKVFKIREILFSIENKMNGLHILFTDIFNNFSNVFDMNTNYESFMSDTCKVHDALDKIYFEYINKMKNLSSDLMKWDIPFKDLDKDLKEQIECRKTFDHYDEKMEKLVKQFSKGNGSNNDYVHFENNETKFIESANKYIEKSNYTYNKMQNVLDNRYLMISPLIANFLLYEKNFFDDCSKTLSYFNNIVNRVDQLKFGLKKTQYKYNAADCLRGKHLLNKVPRPTEHVKEKNGEVIITGVIPGIKKANTTGGNNVNVNGGKNSSNKNNNNNNKNGGGIGNNP
jgi:hypothetical protein